MSSRQGDPLNPCIRARPGSQIIREFAISIANSFKCHAYKLNVKIYDNFNLHAVFVR